MENISYWEITNRGRRLPVKLEFGEDYEEDIWTGRVKVENVIRRVWLIGKRREYEITEAITDAQINQIYKEMEYFVGD